MNAVDEHAVRPPNGEAQAPDPTPAGGETPRKRRLTLALLAVLVLIGSTLAFHAGRADSTGGDSLWTVQTSWSMMRHGDLQITRYTTRSPFPQGAMPSAFPAKGEVYNIFPWGASVVAAPFVAIEAVRLKMVGGSMSETLATRFPARRVEHHIAAMIGGVTVMLMFLLLWMRTRSYGWALLGAGLFAFGTGVASTTTRAMWIQGPGMLVVVIALLCIYALSTSFGVNRRRDLALGVGAGLAAGMAFITRPTVMFIGLIALVIAWRRSRDAFLAVLGGGAAVGVLFIAVNLYAYGVVIPRYFGDNRLRWQSAFPEAFAANLVSPARGILVWSPLVIIGIVAYLAHIRRAPFLDHLLVAWCAFHLVVIACFNPWWAGWSVGPRLMVDLLPPLFLLAAAAPAVVRTWSPSGRNGAYVAMAALCLWSVFVNTHAMTSDAPMRWSIKPNVDKNTDRVWDWNKPQFGAGVWFEPEFPPIPYDG